MNLSAPSESVELSKSLWAFGESVGPQLVFSRLHIDGQKILAGVALSLTGTFMDIAKISRDGGIKPSTGALRSRLTVASGGPWPPKGSICS